MADKEVRNGVENEFPAPLWAVTAFNKDSLVKEALCKDIKARNAPNFEIP